MFGAALLTAATAGKAQAAADLPQIAAQPGDIAPWKNSYHANALAPGQWLEFGGSDWGTPVQLWDNGLFNEHGYPRWLNSGKKLRALLTGFDAQHPDLAQGHVVLTWKGWGDIRLSGATAYLADQSSGPATGGLSNGQRVYRFSGDDVLSDLVIHQIAGPSDPITDIKVWLPDPADPDNASLEGKLWHPTFVQRLKDEDWGLLRTTALTRTRGNPQRDWADRRRPDHVFADGILNPREPADGATDSTGRGFAGNRLTGVPYEHLVALANTADLDLWISVPHLASDDYVTRLAQLLRFGSDGNNPYTSPVANPTWAPLEPGRRLFVEYADALWVDGEPQAAWAEAQANQNGLTKPVFLAQHTARVWSLFAPYFSDDAASDNQLVRVGSASTIDEWATHDYLTELGKTSHGHPDVIALNTDFGVGLADWVNTTARQRANTSDPWFYTATTGSSRSADDAYWTSPAFEHHLEEAFNEWQRRLDAALADETQAAPGYLTSTVIQSIEAVVGQVPIVATGGTALQTHHLDTAQAGDEGITHFMTAMSRHPRIADVYRNYLDAAFAIGLVSYIPHALTDNYSARSQWGHLEHVGQASNTAPKYQFLRDYLAGDTAGLDTAGAGRTARAAAEPVPLAAASIPTAFAVQTRAAPAGTNLIRNGSFENPVVTGNKGRYQRYTGSQMPGWQITGNIDLITKSVWQPAAGAQLLDLNGTNVGAIQQRVTGLKANGLYQLRFAYARHRSGGGKDPRSADVLVNGQRIARLSTAVAAPNYLTATYKVNANSAGTLLLKFASTSLNTSTGIVFDDIQLLGLDGGDAQEPAPTQPSNPVVPPAQTPTQPSNPVVPAGADYLYLDWLNTTNTPFDPRVSNFNQVRYLPGVTSGRYANWGVTNTLADGVKRYSQTDPGKSPPDGETFGIETEFGDRSVVPRFANTGTVRHYTDCGQTGFQNAGLDRSEFHIRRTLKDLGIKPGAEVWFSWSEYYDNLDRDRLTTVLQFRNQPGPKDLVNQGVITQAQLNSRIDRTAEVRSVTFGGPAAGIVLVPSNGELKYHFFIREGKPLDWEKPKGNIHTVDWPVQTGRWYDFVVNMKYSQSNDGFFRVWVAPSGTPLDKTKPTFAHTGSNMYKYPALFGKQVRPVPELRSGLYRFACKGEGLDVPLTKNNRYMRKHLGPMRILQGSYRENGFELIRPRKEN